MLQVFLLRSITVISIFFSLYLGLFFLFYQKKSNRISNRTLALLLFTMVILVAYASTGTVGFYEMFRPYFKVIYPILNISLIIAPLLLFYVKSYVNYKYKFTASELLHFIPFVLFVFIYILYTIISGTSNYWSSVWYKSRSTIIFLQMLLYVILAFQYIKKNGNTIKVFFNSELSIKMAWIRFLLISFIAIWLANFQSFIILGLFRLSHMCPCTTSTYFLMIFIFINFLIFYTIKYPTLFRLTKKYEYSSLDLEEIEVQKKKLTDYMQLQKPHLNPLINLKELARDTEINPRHLSQIINESFQQNFCDFINHYRIEESKSILLQHSPKEKTILEAAYECGF